EPEPPARGLRRVELVDAELGTVRVAGEVDEQVPEDPVDEPGGNVRPARRQRRERDVELLELGIAPLVDARMLRRRADEEAGEEVRERRVVLPVAQQAGEEFGTTEERALERVRAADDDLVAAAGADGAAVDEELLGREPRGACLVVERERV